MKGRFAPSPTGRIHLGNVWIALLSYLSVRRQKGTYVIRMEDIDLQRSKRELGEALLDDLEWLGFDWDEGPRVGGPEISYWQSERLAYYDDIIDGLRKNGAIYPCFCNRARLQSVASAPHRGEAVHRYDGRCRTLSDAQIESLAAVKSPSLRLKVQLKRISFHDMWQGQKTVDLVPGDDDFVVRRGDGMYAYNLAVVCDDIRMGITEVIRGNDLLDTTVQQLYLYELLHADPPRYGHAPLLMDKEGYRLSKRQHSITVEELRRLQWTPGKILGKLAVTCGLYDAKGTDCPSLTLSDLTDISLEDEALRKRSTVIDTKYFL